MEWPSAATGISWISLSKEPRRRELRRSQAYREQAEALSHTGSFDWNLSSGELVCSDETFRILEDDRSVNRDSISFQRIHPEDLSSAGRVTETIGSELPMSYAPHVLCE